MSHEQAPLRLLDDPALGAEVREALRHTQESSVVYDAQAGLAQHQANLAAGAAAPAWDTATAAAEGGSRTIWAVAAGATATAAIVAAVLSGKPEPQAEPDADPIEVTRHAGAARTVEPQEQPVERQEQPVGPAQPSPVVANEAHEAHEAPAAPPAPKTKTKAKAKPKLSAEAKIALEVKHLAALKQAAASNPKRALQMADAGERKYSKVFSQERQAIAIVALVDLGRDEEARKRAKKFFRSFPRSAQREQIEAALRRANTR